MISTEDFLRELLRPAPAGARAWCAHFPSMRSPLWGGALVAPDQLPDFRGHNAYYSIAAFASTATERKTNTPDWLGVVCVLADDIGTKGVGPEEVRKRFGDPSFRIATSTDNEQWGYLLERLATRDEITRIHKRLVALRLCDQNGNNPVRYGRLPTGINNKPEYRDGFPVACVEWVPERRFGVGRMLARCGADDDNSAARTNSDQLRQQILLGEALHEPLIQLAARLRLRGYAEEDIGAVLRELMNRSEAKDTDRWRERYADIERTVRTAFEKPAFARPAPLDILRQTVAPAFAAGDVPEVIGEFGERWARAAGVDPSGPCVAGVVTAAAALDDGIQLEVNASIGWYEAARLWAAFIGAPGLAKTPSIRAATRQIVELHNRVVNEYAANTAGLDAERDKLPPMPALFTNDATTEKLTEVLRDNPRGLLYLAHELDSWLGAHDAYRSGGGTKDRGEWLQLFDGGEHQVDRVKRGSFLVPNWGVSLLSATTPDALKRLMRGGVTNDGLIQRVIPVMVGAAGPPDRHLTAQAETARWARGVERVWEHRANGRRVRMSEEARALFQTEHVRLQELAGACGAISPSFAGHIAKYPTLLARIALTFHAMAEPQTHPADRALSADTLRLAGRFLGKAFLHARVFYRDLAGGDEAFGIAQRVARWLLAAKPPLEQVARAQIVRAGPDQFHAAGEAAQSAAMTILEDFGWVAPLPGSYQKAHTTWWAVDSRIYALFAEAGAAHRRAREVLRRAILETHQGSAEQGGVADAEGELAREETIETFQAESATEVEAGGAIVSKVSLRAREGKREKGEIPFSRAREETIETFPSVSLEELNRRSGGDEI
jgi:hypothetical protein